MDITKYESIDFRRIPSAVVPTWECGRCGALTPSTITHQSWHDKINKIITIFLNLHGIDSDGKFVMMKSDAELERSGSLSIF